MKKHENKVAVITVGNSGIGHARVAAIELAPEGIRVNAITPGPFDTPIFGKSGAP